MKGHRLKMRERTNFPGGRLGRDEEIEADLFGLQLPLKADMMDSALKGIIRLRDVETAGIPFV
ncbi:MAG: hypothetical protein U0792_16240 [Gemmataceae bacterium]